jgi:hypothetical protein
MPVSGAGAFDRQVQRAGLHVADAAPHVHHVRMEHAGREPYAAARRAGHGVAVAESRYVDLVKVPANAKTLEAAMQIEAEVERVIARAGAGSSRGKL